MAPRAKIVLLGGMGYPVTETNSGMPTLKKMFEAVGCEVLMVNWSHRGECYNFAKDWVGPLAYFGDSLGAGSAGEYPGDLHRSVDFAGGFQPSDDDARTQKTPDGQLVQIISPNIKVAHCVYDPVWWHTLGLGQTHWIKPLGSTTDLTVTPHPGAHPDDWGVAQHLLYTHCMSIFGDNKAK